MCCGRPSKASGRTQVEFSPKMKGATETTRVWPFLHRFFAKICQEKKHNQIFYNNFINGNTMEEGFEPAKEEAVRIFLEGGVPTSCWELRNRHLKTLWDRVSGVHEVHMGNTWSITGLFLVNGLLGPILWSVHFDKALTGKDANWSIPVPAVWLQQQDGWASMRRGTWATSFSKLPYFREMQVGENSITWPNRLFCSQEKEKEWTTIVFPHKNTILIGSLLRLHCTNPIHVPTKMCFVTW